MIYCSAGMTFPAAGQIARVPFPPTPSFFFLPVVCLLDFPFKRRGQILRSSSHISPARKKKGSLLIWRRGGGFRRPGLKVWRAEVGELRLDSARRLETCASAGIISVAVTDSSVCIFVIRSGSLTWCWRQTGPSILCCARTHTHTQQQGHFFPPHLQP